MFLRGKCMRCGWGRRVGWLLCGSRGVMIVDCYLGCEYVIGE
jgi:hypothetical protein